MTPEEFVTQRVTYAEGRWITVESLVEKYGNTGGSVDGRTADRLQKALFERGFPVQRWAPSGSRVTVVVHGAKYLKARKARDPMGITNPPMPEALNEVRDPPTGKLVLVG